MSSRQHAKFLPLSFRFESSMNQLTLRMPNGDEIRSPCTLSDDVSDINYMGMRMVPTRKVLNDWNSIIREATGEDVTLVRSVIAGGGVDILPLTLFTTGSLKHLEDKVGCKVHPHRFRANIIIDADEPHVEDGWQDRLLHVGRATLRIRSSVPRCAVTQFDPDTGANDLRTIPALMQYRERVHLPDSHMPHYAAPAFASYAEVVTPGLIRLGDPVSLDPAW